MTASHIYPDTLEYRDIRVFLPNGKALQFPIGNVQEITANELMDHLAEHYQIDKEVATEALAFWMVSPLLEIQLKPHHTPFEMYEKWPALLHHFTNANSEKIDNDEPLIILRRNVLLTSEREIECIDQSHSDHLVEFLYICAKDEYFNGRYLVDVETALKLAGLELAIDYETFGGRQHALDLIWDNYDELVPAQHIRTIRTFRLFGLELMECKAGLENQIIDEYQTASCYHLSTYERRNAYLTLLRKTPFYGAAFFPATLDPRHLPLGRRHRRRFSVASLFGAIRNRFFMKNLAGADATSKIDVLVGINHQYITIIDPRGHRLLHKQRMDESDERSTTPSPVSSLSESDSLSSTAKSATSSVFEEKLSAFIAPTCQVAAA